MKKLSLIALAAVAAGANAQLLGGTIAVVTINDGGSSAPVNSGNLGSIRNYSTSGTLLGTYASNTYFSGTATSEGALNYDEVSNTLWIGGYASVSGGGSLNSSSIDRRIQGLNASTGTYNSPTDYLATNLYTSNNIRSAIVSGGVLVTAGTSTSTGGTRVGTLGGSTSIASGTVTNTRVAQIWGSDAVWSSASGTTSIFSRPLDLSGAPTDLISTKPTGTWSPYDFLFIGAGGAAGNSTLYVADDGSSSVNGGILKFTRNMSGTYDFAYRIQLTGFTGATGLGIANGKLYATTSNGLNLIELTDPGAGGALTPTILATAGTNERFRGLEVVPEPASMIAMAVGVAGLAARRRRKNS